MRTDSLATHRVRIVTGTILTGLHCIACRRQLTNDSRVNRPPRTITEPTRAYADLDGKPFVDYYCYQCATAMGADLDVIRYVVTHVNKDGYRVLSHGTKEQQ